MKLFIFENSKVIIAWHLTHIALKNQFQKSRYNPFLASLFLACTLRQVGKAECQTCLSLNGWLVPKIIIEITCIMESNDLIKVNIPEKKENCFNIYETQLSVGEWRKMSRNYRMTDKITMWISTSILWQWNVIDLWACLYGKGAISNDNIIIILFFDGYNSVDSVKYCKKNVLYKLRNEYHPHHIS